MLTHNRTLRNKIDIEGRALWSMLDRQLNATSTFPEIDDDVAAVNESSYEEWKAKYISDIGYVNILFKLTD
jgi:hypothetical protein